MTDHKASPNYLVYQVGCIEDYTAARAVLTAVALWLVPIFGAGFLAGWIS